MVMETMQKEAEVRRITNKRCTLIEGGIKTAKSKEDVEIYQSIEEYICDNGKPNVVIGGGTNILEALKEILKYGIEYIYVETSNRGRGVCKINGNIDIK